MTARHIGDIVANVQINTFTQKKNESDDAETMRIVDMLFDELMSIFPAYKYAFDSQDIFDLAKKNWFLALKDSGIHSIDAIKIGLTQARKSINPFFPSCGQFVSWCNPSDEMLGMPSKEDAYLISIEMNRQFSSVTNISPEVESVIRNCLSSIGPMEYRAMRAEESRKVFYYMYDLTLKKYAKGEIKIIPKAIPAHTKSTPEDRERANAARDNTMSYLRSNFTFKKDRECALDTP